jgi:hypothetical protein
MTEEILHNPIAESYWRAVIANEIEQAKRQLVNNEKEASVYDKTLSIIRGIK